MPNKYRPESRHRRPSIETLDPRLMLNADYRPIDGFGNNAQNPDWGTPDSQLLRLTTVEYEDGLSEPAGGYDGSGRPNPRAVSNAVVAQSEDILNDRGLTNFVFQWGQFIDHDLSLTEEAHPVTPFHIDVPQDDPTMFPEGIVPLLRSRFDISTGEETPRQQINQITSYIDASMVYGSDAERALALRTLSGGQLKTSGDALLPLNEDALYNAAPPPFAPEEYYLAGDIRANEQPGLTSMHTLFVREHNRLAEEISERDFAGQDLSEPEIDEAIYQQARQVVVGLVQSITYDEFLPALLGPTGTTSYTGYDSEVNPGIANIFSAALYRVGHTMLPNELAMLDDAGDPVLDDAGGMPLADSFFQPSIVADFGIEPFLKGLSEQLTQEIDVHIVDAVRNMLFDPPAQFDLAAINIQRGRDHGLPDYNQAREDFGLEPRRWFGQIAPWSTARELGRAYDWDINNIDVWLGAIAERHVPGASVGELIHNVLVDQFSRVRDGDRFYFENTLPDSLIQEVKSTTLADIIHRNTALTSLDSEVFRADSVLVYRADSQSAIDVLVTQAGRDIQIVDQLTDTVLAEAPRSQIEQVVIFGSDQADTISVAGSLSRRNVELEIHGGADEDRLRLVGRGRSDFVSIGDGTLRFNRLSATFGEVESVQIDARGGSDYIDGSRSSVPLIIAGGNGHDRIAGSAFADLILGGGGHDIIAGLGGNDLIVGGNGHDMLFGNMGDDILIGGRGRDWLFGGAGEDIELQGGFPDEDDRSGSLWDEALARWQDDLLRYGLL